MSGLSSLPGLPGPSTRLRRRNIVEVTDSDDEYDVEASLPSTPLAEVTDFKPFDSPTPSEMRQEVKKETVEAGEKQVDTDDALREVDEQGEYTTQESHGDQRVCRICFGGAEEEESMGKLISPCMCTGSMRHVHLKCINAWRESGTHTTAFMQCPQCKYQYHVRRTLIAGIATSKPMVALLSILLFISINLMAGSILFHWLRSSSSWRRKLLTYSTIFDTQAADTDNGYYYFNEGGGWRVQFFGGQSILFEVVVSAIQTFTGLSVVFAQAVGQLDNILPEWAVGTIFHLGVRFLLGMAILGSVAFCSLIVSITIMGPMHLFNMVSGISAIRNWRRESRRTGGNDIGQVLIVAFVFIGVLHTMWKFYAWVQKRAGKMLFYLEEQILEVNPDERQKEQDKRTQEREQSWIRRWVREGRWKNLRGWYELVVRSWIASKNALVAQWTRTKEAWVRGWPVEAD